MSVNAIKSRLNQLFPLAVLDMPYRSVCAPQYLSDGTCTGQRDVYVQLTRSRYTWISPNASLSVLVCEDYMAKYLSAASLKCVQSPKHSQVHTILEDVDNDLKLGAEMLQGRRAFQRGTDVAIDLRVGIEESVADVPRS